MYEEEDGSWPVVPDRSMPGRVGDRLDAAGVMGDDGVVVAVVTASQNAARPGSVEQAPHVLGSPVQTGSAGAGAGASVMGHSFLPPLLFEDLSESGTEVVEALAVDRGGERESG